MISAIAYGVVYICTSVGLRDEFRVEVSINSIPLNRVLLPVPP